MSSSTVVSIVGFFRVSSFQPKGEYPAQATIIEIGEDYPQVFNLNLPEGHVWQKGETVKLSLTSHPVTFKLKAGGSMMKYNVTDYKKEEVTLEIKVKK